MKYSRIQHKIIPNKRWYTMNKTDRRSGFMDVLTQGDYPTVHIATHTQKQCTSRGTPGGLPSLSLTTKGYWIPWGTVFWIKNYRVRNNDRNLNSAIWEGWSSGLAFCDVVGGPRPVNSVLQAVSPCQPSTGITFCFQCFDIVGWATGSASNL